MSPIIVSRHRSILAAFAIVIAVIVATFPALAVSPVNTNGGDAAISGYDPVAYFTAGKPTKGSDQFTATWNGTVFRFASAENRDTFQAAPEKYAPQYGGYCAWAVSQGYTATIDPRAWKVVDGKLYLNYSKGIQRRWERDEANLIVTADKNWPGIVGE